MDPHDLITVIGNFVIFSMRYAFIAYFLNPRVRWRIIIPSFLIGITAVWFASSALPFLSVIRYIIGESVFFIPVLIFFCDPLPKKLLYYGLSAIAMISSELIVTTMIFAYSSGSINNIVMYSIFIGVMGLILGIMIIVLKRTGKAASGHLKSHNYIAFFFLAVAEGIMLLGWINYSFEHFSAGSNIAEYIVPVIISIAACIFADLFMMKTLTDIADAARAEVENRALSAQVKAQKEYYSLIDSEYREIRRLRHDISNHLYTINALLDEGKTELAAKYADDLKSEKFITPVHICSNITADAFLIHKINSLKSEDITVDASGLNIPDSICLTDVELITVLGNLLDNAAEACRHQNDKTIRLLSETSHGFITITTENNVPEDYDKQQHFEGIERGTGSVILEELADKYGGHFSKSSANGTFKSSFSVPADRQ